jgi:hypothetical protein
MPSRASLLIFLLLLLWASPAYALKHVSPPGNAAVGEYQEDVPSADGAVPVGAVPIDSSAEPALPRSVLTRLNHDGATGRDAAQLAERTAPQALGEVQQSPSATGGNQSTPPPTTGFLGQLAMAAVGGGGLGLLLPVAILACLGAATGMLIARRRSRRGT